MSDEPARPGFLPLFGFNFGPYLVVFYKIQRSSCSYTYSFWDFSFTIPSARGVVLIEFYSRQL